MTAPPQAAAGGGGGGGGGGLLDSLGDAKDKVQDIGGAAFGRRDEEPDPE
jgi:hypothetical protein